jgi:hypothetical protein
MTRVPAGAGRNIKNAMEESERKRWKKGFAFVMDEWDAIFYKKVITEEDKIDYLEFGPNMLKGQADE